MDFKCQVPKFKRVYSLRINQELRKMGFEPVTEADNVQKPGFVCWVYEASPAFLEALDRAISGKEENYG